MNISRLLLAVFLSLSLPLVSFAEGEKELFPPIPTKKLVIGATVIVLVVSRFDRGIRADIFNWQNADESKDMRRLGDKAQIAGPVLGTAFLLQGLAFDNRKSVDTGVLSYEAFVVSGLTCFAIKALLGRERPVETSDSDRFRPFRSDSSFPSGHTTVAFAAATVFSEQYPHWYVIAPSYGVASAVGFSRMYANKHWMSDVVAGAFLGTTAAHLLRRHRKRSATSAWRLEPNLDGVQLVRRF